MENKWVKVTTQAEFDQLMDSYNQRGWKWRGGELPHEYVVTIHTMPYYISFQDSFTVTSFPVDAGFLVPFLEAIRPDIEPVTVPFPLFTKQDPMLNAMQKKLLDADTQKLMEAGFIDSELDITCEGSNALETILFSVHKDELVKMAAEKIAEGGCCKEE